MDGEIEPSLVASGARTGALLVREREDSLIWDSNSPDMCLGTYHDSVTACVRGMAGREPDPGPLSWHPDELAGKEH